MTHNPPLLLPPFGSSARKPGALSHQVGICRFSELLRSSLVFGDLSAGRSRADPAAALIIEDPIESRSSCWVSQRASVEREELEQGGARKWGCEELERTRLEMKAPGCPVVKPLRGVGIEVF